MPHLLILTIGIPAAGKTTWIENYVKRYPGTVVISNDKIRQELTGTADCKSSQNPRIYMEALRRARKALDDGNDVVVDGCHVDLKDWVDFRQICDPGAILVAKVFDVAPPLAMEHMKQRSRKVPEDVVWAKYHTLNHNKKFLPFLFNYVL